MTTWFTVLACGCPPVRNHLQEEIHHLLSSLVACRQYMACQPTREPYSGG